jgi:hypothetical protein
MDNSTRPVAGWLRRDQACWAFQRSAVTRRRLAQARRINFRPPMLPETPIFLTLASNEDFLTTE